VKLLIDRATRANPNYVIPTAHIWPTIIPAVKVVIIGNVTIADGGRLVFNYPATWLLADTIVNHGEIASYGHLAIVCNQVSGGSGTIGAHVTNGQNGADGGPGQDHGGDAPPATPPQAAKGPNANSVGGPAGTGEIGTPGGNGESGTQGGPGSNGGNGTPGATVTITTNVLGANLNVTADGGNGGNGGNGGPAGGGGPAGQGGQGGDGGDGDWFRCDGSGGDGGPGGRGGDAGVGGNGGSGGNGGLGGGIFVTYQVDASAGTDTFEANGGAAGSGGQRGTDGHPGFFGPGGPGGNTGTGAKLASGCTDHVGAQGPDGQNGLVYGTEPTAGNDGTDGGVGIVSVTQT
jgi:hypothetical protein